MEMNEEEEMEIVKERKIEEMMEMIRDDIEEMKVNNDVLY